MATARIYTVTDKSGTTRLVEATHPANALRHVATDTLTAALATQHELVTLIGKGVKVEQIKGEQQALPST